MTKANVMILTSGLSGSSVVSNLISRAGYWSGDQTYKKKDYDTHENEQLVILNETILEQIGYKGRYTREIDYAAVQKIQGVDEFDNHSKYVEFVKACNQYSPWIWKDPRLWVTVPYWDRILGDNIKYIHLDRSLFQRWISVNLRRQIQTFSYLKRYSNGINQIISSFLQQQDKDSLFLNYDDLIMEPEVTLQKINEYLDCQLTLDDLKAVYKYPLYKKNRGFIDFMKAVSVYLKNYSQRYR